MHLDIQLLYMFIGIGLTVRKLSWRGWVGVGLAIFVWMMYNWVKSMRG